MTDVICIFLLGQNIIVSICPDGGVGAEHNGTVLLLRACVGKPQLHETGADLASLIDGHIEDVNGVEQMPALGVSLGLYEQGFLQHPALKNTLGIDEPADDLFSGLLLYHFRGGNCIAEEADF